MQSKVQLKLVKPNPFRDIEAYPINEEKIAALMESYERTGFWGNIVARNNGTGVEIAYGHHRLEAMRRSMKGTTKIELIIKDVSDSDMIRMMADENMSEWTTNSKVEQETVRAIVIAYSEGKIELPKVPSKTKKNVIRYAPKFVRASSLGSKEHPYVAETIAEFLGWTQPNGKPSMRVHNALTILETAEDLDAEEDFEEITKGLGSDQAREIAAQVKTIKKVTEKDASPAKAKKKALRAGKELASTLRKGGSIRDVREQALKFKGSKKSKKKEVPDIDDFVEDVAGYFDGFLRSDSISEKLNALLKHKEHISASQEKKLIVTLRGAGKRCSATADRFTANSPKPRKRIKG